MFEDLLGPRKPEAPPIKKILQTDQENFKVPKNRPALAKGQTVNTAPTTSPDQAKKPEPEPNDPWGEDEAEMVKQDGGVPYDEEEELDFEELEDENEWSEADESCEDVCDGCDGCDESTD